MASMNSLPSTTNSSPKSKVRKALFRGLLALAVSAIVAQLIYTYSGSNQWVNLGERNGVTVYSLKSPGSNLKKFRAVWKVHSRLSKFVMFADDSSTDLGIGYYDIQELEKPTEKVIFTAWKMKMPSPFKPRQFVVRTEFTQDPKTKELLYTVSGTPNKIAPDNCCVRLPVMNNSWRLTPLGNGEIQIEWYVDMDMGLPYILANAAAVSGIYEFAPKVQGFLDRALYSKARYDWIEEL